MKNSEQPAYPRIGTDEDGDTINFKGLTKREYFVGQVLPGINMISAYETGYNAEQIAIMSIRLADEILKQLEDHE